MLNTPPEELLSAYLDGELSPEEIEYVERLLAEDAALREQLAELKDLSLTIRQIPKVRAPVDLQASVLSALEQISPAQKPAVVTVANHRRSSRRFWPGAAAVCVVVGLLIGSIILPQVSPRQSVNMDGRLIMTSPTMERMQETAKPEVLSASPAERMFMTSSPDRAVTMKSAAPPAAPAAATTSALSAEAPVPGPAPVAMSFFKEQDGAQFEPPVPVVELTGDQIRQKIVEVGRLPISGNSIQVPSQISTADGMTPIIVEFTVVDAKLAVNQLQVLVKKQQVRTLDNHVLGRQPGSGRDAPLSTVSVELELDGPEMVSVLNQVPALDAVLYLPETAMLPESEILMGDTDSQKMMSRASIPAKPSPASAQAVSQKSADRRQFEQPVQFRFDQLAQTPGSQSGQAQQNFKSTQLGVNVPIPFNPPAQPQGSTTADKLLQKDFGSQNRQMPSLIESQSQPLAKTASPRYRAFILLQQTK